MGRGKTPKYDYPKSNGTSLSAISKIMFGISYVETTDTQMRKVKKKFRELN